MRRTVNHRVRDPAARAWVLLIVLTLGPACATTPSEPAAGARVPTVAPSAVPLPPPEIPPEVEAAWLELRAGARLEAPTASSPEGRTLAGFALLRQGDNAGARTAFEAALADRPELAVAAYGLGLTALAENRPQQAREQFEAALAADPQLARAAMQVRALRITEVQGALTRAEAAVRQGDLQGAADAYRAALTGAPDVAALYMRLAEVERTREDVAAAIAVLELGRRRAGDEPALLRRLGGLYRQEGELGRANEVYGRLAALSPEDERAQALAEEVRRSFEEASLPPEYRDLPDAPVITRQELAAILAIHLEEFMPGEGDEAVIVSDLMDQWAAPFVQRVVQWDVLDVYQNNAFWPEMEVRRSMLVEAAYRTLEAVGLAAEAPRAGVEDPPREHLLYVPVQVVVGLDIMQARPDGSFELLERVTGAEAIATTERLVAAIRRLQG